MVGDLEGCKLMLVGRDEVNVERFYCE